MEYEKVFEGKMEDDEDIMQTLALEESDEGVSELQEIIDIFVPVINAWRSGSCGMGCAGCTGSCGG